MSRKLQIKKSNTNGFSRRRRAAEASSNQPSRFVEEKVQLPPETTYLVNIRVAHRYFHLNNQDAFALAECDGKGKLTNQYCLLEKLTFASDAEQRVLLVCSCAGGKEQRDRLAMTSEISEDIDGFIKREQGLYCIHAKTALKLASDDFDPNSVPQNDDVDTFVDLLSTTPFLAVAYNNSYGLISRQSVGNTTKVRCNRCTYQTCAHTKTFMEWCTTQGLTEEILPQILDEEDGETYPSVSHRSIPYPLSERLRSIHDTLESGERQSPLNLLPHMEDSTCIHGNRYVMCMI